MEVREGIVLLDTASVSRVDPSDCVQFHMWLHAAFGFTHGFTQLLDWKVDTSNL